jgi:oligosaccharyltransferase complex subunit alpha (ribophorin I)
VLIYGGRNVKYFTNIPESAIAKASLDIKKTYLDTMGRTAVIIKASNLVDEFRDREFVISYDYSLAAALRKPLVVFTSMVGVFVAGWIIGGLEFRIATKN